MCWLGRLGWLAGLVGWAGLAGVDCWNGWLVRLAGMAGPQNSLSAFRLVLRAGPTELAGVSGSEHAHYKHIIQ